MFYPQGLSNFCIPSVHKQLSRYVAASVSLILEIACLARLESVIRWSVVSELILAVDCFSSYYLACVSVSFQFLYFRVFACLP
jgi:hypothetical protein